MVPTAVAGVMGVGYITVIELTLIVVACALWGPGWQGKMVRCLCDNDAVIIVLRSGTSKYPLVMRCLYQLYMDGTHLPGT